MASPPCGDHPIARRELLRFARSMRAIENQRLHDCANAFVSPQPAGEEYHWQRLMAWDVLISDIKGGLPYDKVIEALAALALGEASQ